MNRPTFASSSAASTSSSTQNGAGRTSSIANRSATAVSARSPPESIDSAWGFLPGGRAVISMPVADRSVGSVRTSFAKPPPNSCWKRASKASSSWANVARNWVAMSSSRSAISWRVCAMASRRSLSCASSVSSRSRTARYSSTANGFAAPSSWNRRRSIASRPGDGSSPSGPPRPSAGRACRARPRGAVPRVRPRAPDPPLRASSSAPGSSLGIVVARRVRGRRRPPASIPAALARCRRPTSPRPASSTSSCSRSHVQAEPRLHRARRRRPGRGRPPPAAAPGPPSRHARPRRAALAPRDRRQAATRAPRGRPSRARLAAASSPDDLVALVTGGPLALARAPRDPGRRPDPALGERHGGLGPGPASLGVAPAPLLRRHSPPSRSRRAAKLGRPRLPGADRLQLAGRGRRRPAHRPASAAVERRERGRRAASASPASRSACAVCHAASRAAASSSRPAARSTSSARRRADAAADSAARAWSRAARASRAERAAPVVSASAASASAWSASTSRASLSASARRSSGESPRPMRTVNASTTAVAVPGRRRPSRAAGRAGA